MTKPLFSGVLETSRLEFGLAIGRRLILLEDGMLESVEWPVNVAEIDDVKSWIASIYPDAGAVTGPSVVYASKDNFGVTARFVVVDSQGSRNDVVFKANVYTGYSGAAYAFDLLSRYCSGMVPDVIGWEGDHGKSQILFRPFIGMSVRESRSLDRLLETARVVARIQNIVSALSLAEVASLSRVSMLELADLFEDCVSNIHSKYWTYWEQDQNMLALHLAFPVAEVLERLDLLRVEVRSWCNELEVGHWPDSICHGDLHGSNAVVQLDGSVLIYDWEDAYISCPMLILDRLLIEAWIFDTGAESGPWGYYAGTPGQEQVLAAYVDMLIGHTRAERERACRLALCLAVVRELHAEQLAAKAMGLKDGNAEWSAQLINRLFEHRKALNHA